VAAFLIDDFTDTNATALTSHTGQVGATWTLPGTESGTTASIFAGGTTASSQLRNSGSATATGHYLSSGTPPSADYWVRATWRIYTVPNERASGITLRTDSTCANCYLVQYNTDLDVWQLFKKVAGAFSQLGSNVAQTLTLGAIYELYFSIVGNQIDFTVDGVSKFSTTDSSVTSAGKVGIRISTNATAGYKQVAIHPEYSQGVERLHKITIIDAGHRPV
jgi:hypothetical protein